MKVGQRLSALSVREMEGVIDLLVHCSVSIFPSLKAEGWVNIFDTVKTAIGINMFLSGCVCTIV